MSSAAGFGDRRIVEGTGELFSKLNVEGGLMHSIQLHGSRCEVPYLGLRIHSNAYYPISNTSMLTVSMEILTS